MKFNDIKKVYMSVFCIFVNLIMSHMTKIKILVKVYIDSHYADVN